MCLSIFLLYFSLILRQNSCYRAIRTRKIQRSAVHLTGQERKYQQKLQEAKLNSLLSGDWSLKTKQNGCLEFLFCFYF